MTAFAMAFGVLCGMRNAPIKYPRVAAMGTDKRAIATWYGRNRNDNAMLVVAVADMAMANRSALF